MNRFNVRKVAVLGAGVMGAQIAAHLVNVKVPVVLFDLPAKDGPKNGNFAPSFHIIDHIIYHTSLDVPELVPATGLERATRAFAAAVIPGRTTMIIAETPANPRLDIIDLAAIGAIPGPIKVVDSTFATPLGQRPLEFGIDLVVHSATKAIAGHNDAMIGVVAGARDYLDWLYSFAVIQGANASPFDAMNALRGLRTLAVRFERQTENALALAAFLEAHPKVSEVRHPGLPSHPQYDLAQRQMDLTGGLLTFEIAAGADGALEAGRRFVESVQIAQLATSLGGPETLVTHPASTTHASLTPEELDANGITPATIRVSVGLEHDADLIADFAQALDRV